MLSILSMVGYMKAPRTGFVLRHPIRSMKMMRTRRMIRHRMRDPRVAAGVGAALALGLWMRRRMRAHA